MWKCWVFSLHPALVCQEEDEDDEDMTHWGKVGCLGSSHLGFNAGAWEWDGYVIIQDVNKDKTMNLKILRTHTQTDSGVSTELEVSIHLTYGQT